MSVKLILSWDILPDHEQEYFEFVISEFIPGVQRMGLEPVEAWATIYGSYPQIQVGILAPNTAGVQRVMISTTWTELYDKLMKFVSNFKYKIVQAKGGFQL